MPKKQKISKGVCKKDSLTGFTALEILVSLSIMAFLIVVSVGSFSKVRNARALDSAVESASSLIREARSRAMASEDGSQFGVYFEPSRAVLFKGTVFMEGDPNNKTYLPPNEVEIASVNFLASSIVFKKLTGDAENPGNVSVRLKNDPANAKTIFVNEAGLIYAE